MQKTIEMAVMADSLEVVRTSEAQINGTNYALYLHKAPLQGEWKGDLLMSVQEMPTKELMNSVTFDVLEFMKFTWDGKAWLLDREGNYTREFPIKGSPFDKETPSTSPNHDALKTEWGRMEMSLGVYLLTAFPLRFNFKDPIVRAVEQGDAA